jgi:hypothetical protein
MLDLYSLMFILAEMKMKTEIWEEYGPNFAESGNT